MTTYSIIGSGAVGSALASQFARSGLPVGIANTRGPESIGAAHKATPLRLEDALKADVIILAVPFRAHAAVAGARADWSGKLVIDATNTYDIPFEEFAGKPSTGVLASAFVGARIVKTFNQLSAALLARDPSDDGGRRVMFVASDDADAERSAAALVEALGFAAIPLGRLDEGGRLIVFGGNGMRGPLVLNNLVRHA